MKIKEIQLYTYSIPTDLFLRLRRGIIVVIMDEEGRRGVGEIAPLPGWSDESFDEALSFTKKLKAKILTKDFEPVPFPPSVMFGMESALNQLRSPLDEDLHFSLTKLLCSPEEHLERLLEAKLPLEGSLKVKLGEYKVPQAIRLMEKLLDCNIKSKLPKTTNGEETTIRVDLNRKWTLSLSVEFCRHFQSEDIFYLEDPTTIFSDLEKFYDQTGFSYALDEYLLMHPIERLRELRGLSYFVIKPTLHGGLTQCRQIVKGAREIPCTFSSSYETSIGLSHIIRIAKELSPDIPHGIDTLSLLKEDLLPSPSPLSLNHLNKDAFNDMPLDFSKLQRID